jgi:hypothetical protein
MWDVSTVIRSEETTIPTEIAFSPVDVDVDVDCIVLTYYSYCMAMPILSAFE